MGTILLSIFAGIVGTGIGGVLSALFGNKTDKTVSMFLSFAGGVMTSIVFFELMPDATQHADTAVVLLGLAMGVLLVLVLNAVIDRVSKTGQGESKIHESFQEYYHEGKVLAGTNSMMRSGLLMFLVIGLHNIPEGLVIGAAGNHDSVLSFTLAFMIGVHNIPEGMAIAAPLITGGMSRWKSVLLTLIAGIPTVVGALVGLLVGGMSDLAMALSFAIASGAMLYAVFGEILPQSFHMSKDRVPTIVLLIGVAFGFLMTRI
ncbi:MAG: ZIP family metal transporter [Clostridiales bacterium]|nr:ZIP family metal transporter [Clostridiales bacterium]